MAKKRQLHEEEITRTVAILRRLPRELLPWLTSNQLINAYKLRLARNTVGPILRKYVEGRKPKEGSSEVSLATVPAAARNSELAAQLTLEQLARVATKTYAYCGDAETISTEDAQRMMLRQLRRFDPSLLTRNEKRKPNVG